MGEAMDKPVAGVTASVPSQRRDVAEARLRALTDIGRAALTAHPDEAFEGIVRAARIALAGASISLGVWEPERQHLRTLVNEGELADWEEAHPVDETYPADQSTWLAGMKDGHLGLALSLDDALLHPEDREYLLRLGKHSSVTVPILLGGQWWGELWSARRADQPAYCAGDLDWASAVAAQVGAALEAVERLGSFASLAKSDSLTGLANRRAVDEWMAQAMAAWRDAGRRVGLVVCDLNGLKRVNDAEGHDAGDSLLVAFAQQLRQIAAVHTGRSEGPLLARLGGDEFCLAFSGNEADVVVRAAEEICERGWDVLPDGVACGVALTGAEAGPVDTSTRLFRLADAAQYRAKRTRSRRPVVAGRALPPDAQVPLRFDERVSPDRRMMRSRDRQDAAHLVESTLRALDQAYDEAARTRLGLVGDLVSHQCDAVGWWLSLAPAGSSQVSTAEFAVYRQMEGLTPEDVDAGLGLPFEVADYPLTASALHGGSYYIRAEDPTADPGELAILDALGARAVVAAGVREPAGDAWLLEIFADDLTGSLRELPGLLRVLMLAAVHPPRPNP